MERRYTKFTQCIYEPDKTPTMECHVIKNVKSTVIRRLSRSLPYPSTFFYDLNKKGVAAAMLENGTRITLSLIEFNPDEKDSPK